MRPYDSEDSIGCVHGLRVLSLCIVIVGHRAEAIASSPLLNPDSLEKVKLFISVFFYFLREGKPFFRVSVLAEVSRGSVR